jgi:Carboxypeptidase regulatory-like domain/TonB dependent receptor
MMQKGFRLDTSSIASRSHCEHICATTTRRFVSRSAFSGERSLDRDQTESGVGALGGIVITSSGRYSSFAKWMCVWLFLCSLLFSAGPTRGQVSGATLSGLVTDENGGSVPGANVSIKNLGTGVARDVTTNADGFYSTPNLIPGTYEVRVSAKGFQTVVQKEITLNVGAQHSLNVSLKLGQVTQTVVVNATPPDVQTTSSTISDTVDSKTVRQLPLNGRDWTSLATLEPGVVSIPNQATTSFSANKGNRGFGNQLSNGGHRANENNYRVNAVSINDYSNSAPGGATGVNLGVDAIQEFSVLTSNYTAEYGRTSGAVINAITKSGTDQFHGTGYFFDRDSIFDARNFFDKQAIAPFRRIQFGASGGTAIIKDKTFVFGNYEGIRQNSSSSGTIRVPSQNARNGILSTGNVTVDPKVAPYLALWPCPASCQNATSDVVVLSSTTPNRASENYVISRIDQRLSKKDNLSGSYFFDSGPQSQADPLGNTVHQVFSRRQMVSAEDTHIFSVALANTIRGGFSRVIGNINTPVSGDAVAKNGSLAIAPGASAPPQIPISGITTAFGLGGFNKFNHAWNSIQVYDDAFLTRGTHSIKFGFAFERMQYNILEQLSPNGRMNSYSLAAFLTNAPNKLNALAPGGSFEVGLRESLFAGYIQDDWRFRPNITLNIGLRYEMTTLPTDSHTIPGYTVNGYTVATAGFQQIQTLANCTPGTTACGPVGTNSPISNNPTTKNFEPRIGVSWDPRKNGKTAVRAGFGIFDVLPLPYEFGLNTSATAPFQIIGADPAATLGTGTPDTNINFNRQSIRNRMIDPNPHRADVLNWNLNIQHEIANGWTGLVGYVGSRSVHLSVASDDINLVQPRFVSGAGFVFPCDPSQIVPYTVKKNQNCASKQTGTRIDSNWGGVAGIRPVIFDGAASYNAFQSQLKKASTHGVQGQASYTFGKCRDTSSAPVTGDTYLNSIAVPLLLVKRARLGACDFDIRQTFTGSVIWDIPGPKSGTAGLVAGGWEMGTIVTASTGAPFTVTVGDGNDPLGTGFNGDFSMNFANLLPGCNPIQGGLNYLNTACFTPPTAPASLAPATAANPFGCAPLSYTKFPVAPPAGQQFCSNVLGNSGRNRFYGPGLTTVDFSVFKNTRVPRISETFNVQFRAEFFNVLNHTNFLSPGFLNTFGQNNSAFDFDGSSLPTALNQTSTTSRQIQLGLKLVW